MLYYKEIDFQLSFCFQDHTQFALKDWEQAHFHFFAVSFFQAVQSIFRLRQMVFSPPWYPVAFAFSLWDKLDKEWFYFQVTDWHTGRLSHLPSITQLSRVGARICWFLYQNQRTVFTKPKFSQVDNFSCSTSVPLRKLWCFFPVWLRVSRIGYKKWICPSWYF